MERQSCFESVSEFAISRFKESIEENEENGMNLLEEYNFIHWKAQNVWNKNFSKQLEIMSDQREIDNHFLKFKNDLNRIMSKRSEYNSMRKYFDYVIEHQINEIRYKTLNLDQIENFYNENLANTNSQIDSNKSTNKLNDTISVKNNLLKKIYQYEIENLIRAHSKDNNLNDNTTQVNDLAFEISPMHTFGDLDILPSYTNLCATCGHSIVNIIDTETGKIIKRFNDDMLSNQTRDVNINCLEKSFEKLVNKINLIKKKAFNCISWTILNNATSALACGGTHGQIKIIIPKYSSCITRIDAHNGPITSLLFHYKYPNILLSGSDDKTIKVWRLNLKEGATSLDSECSYKLICTIDYNSTKSKKKEIVNSICFIQNDYLLIATSGNIYFVNLSDENLFDSTLKELKSNSNETSSEQDVVQFMTSVPDNKGHSLIAKPVKMIGVSENNLIYEELIITNKLIYFNNLIFASLINSNFIYIIEISNEYDEKNDEILILNVVSHIPVGEGKSSPNNKMSLYKDDSFVYILKATPDGVFYNLTMNKNLRNYITIMKYSIPVDYTIKAYSDPVKKTNIKNYGLFEKPIVTNVVCNGNFIVSTTNQNMIITWRKLKAVIEDNSNNL